MGDTLRRLTVVQVDPSLLKRPILFPQAFAERLVLLLLAGNLLLDLPHPRRSNESSHSPPPVHLSILASFLTLSANPAMRRVAKELLERPDCSGEAREWVSPEVDLALSDF